MDRNLLLIGIVLFVFLFAIGVTYADDVVGGVGKAAAQGVKTAIVDVPKAVGGGVSYGFDFVGRILDDAGEKEKEPKPEGKPDPMPSQAYPGQRQF